MVTNCIINLLEIPLQKLNPSLAAKLEETKCEVEHLLSKYSSNFPTYTELYNSSNINKKAIKRLNEITMPLNKISHLKKFTAFDFV